jgi:predicted nucleotidyltransferase
MAVIHDVTQRKAQAAIEVIARRARVRAVYLFGSQVEGTADRFSDIDIAAFVEGAAKWDLQQRVHVSVEAREKVGDDIELHFLPAESLENAPRASFAAYVLRHGVRIL